MFKVKQIIKTILNPSVRSKVKRMKRKMRNALKCADKTSLSDFRRILTDELGLSQGDKIFVTSAFANLNAQGYSPKDAIKVMMEIVGDEGLIMMPYYPPMNSMEWVRKGEVFEMGKTVSGMGVMTNVFAGMEGVQMSEHPLKSVCAWGKDVSRYITDHYKDVDPYGDNTPYGRLLADGHSKSLCLGVVNLPMFHAIEDKNQAPDTLYYDERLYDVPFVTKEGETIVCRTKVHDPNKCAGTIMGGTFAKRFHAPIRKVAKFGYDNIYLIDNSLLEEASRKEFALGKTRKK